MNRQNIIKVLFSLLTVVLITACSFYRPPKHAKKPGKYPEFTRADSLHGHLNEYRTNFDVTYYDLDIEIDPKNHWLGGSVKIYFNALQSIETIQLNLAEQLDVHWIKDFGGKEIIYERELNAIYLDLANYQLTKGDSLMVEVNYSGKPQKAKKPPWKGGAVWKKKHGSHFCGVACEDDGAHIWWPLKDHLTDKPDSMQMSFTVPGNLYCVSNGRLMAEQEMDEGKKKFTWRTSYPINSYNVTYYVGDYTHFRQKYEGENSKLKYLDFYVLKENRQKAKVHFQQAHKMIEIYEKYFGPYPWPKDGYKLVESPYEGMEHQTAIAYGNEYKNPKWLGYDYIILHETAHEWWGNYVTACDLGDMWIHEGFATYAEMIYEEEVKGNLYYEVSYAVNRQSSINKRPIVGPRDVNYSNFKDGDIYVKGATVLHMLRRTIEDDKVFFNIIYRFATENGEHCVCTEDFIKLVNKETQRDLQWFFDQYLFRREAPELFYSIEETEQPNSRILKYKWNEEVTNENFALTIFLVTNNHIERIYPSWEIQEFELKNYYGSVSLFKDEDYVRFTRIKNL